VKANPLFAKQDLGFWAMVKFVSERAVYTNMKTKKNPVSTLKALTPDEVRGTLEKCDIDQESISNQQCKLVSDYLKYRAETLTTKVEPVLMNRDEARAFFEEIKERVKPIHPIPMNRQKGEKRHEAYLAAMVGMLAEEAVGAENLVNDSQKLAILTENGTLKGIFFTPF